MDVRARCGVLETQPQNKNKIVSVAMAVGSHPFPFRTRKLSPPAPMVLGWRRPGRVGRRRDFARSGEPNGSPLFLLWVLGFEAGTLTACLLVGVPPASRPNRLRDLGTWGRWLGGEQPESERSPFLFPTTPRRRRSSPKRRPRRPGPERNAGQRAKPAPASFEPRPKRQWNVALLARFRRTSNKGTPRVASGPDCRRVPHLPGRNPWRKRRVVGCLPCSAGGWNGRRRPTPTRTSTRRGESSTVWERKLPGFPR